jgi:Na+/alanine symporter
MNKFFRKTIFSLFFVLMSSAMLAQNSNATEVEMADALYQSGKIYVVIVVIALIFTGIITYLVMLDKKISKLEKQQKEDEKNK